MRNKTDVVASLFLSLLGIGAIIGAIRLQVGTPTEPQPGFFPFLGGISLIVFSSIIFLKGWRGHGGHRVPFRGVGRPALLLAVMILLVAVLERLGYVIGTFIASGLLLRILNVKSWRVVIFTGFGLALGTYILFDKLLGIELPVGILARLGR